VTISSGVVTFLFTDIEGSTRLWEEHPEAMRLALSQHDDLLRTCIEAHGGRVFKTTGDGICAVFVDPRGAVEAVLAAQQRLPAVGLAVTDGSRPLKVRMALHTGVTEERDGDYFGRPLNRVARLLATGHGGQVLLSQTTFDLVRDGMPAETSARPLGEHRLKDLGRPESIFQLLHPELADDFLPLRSLDNPDLKHNLPQQVTSFVGREKEIGEVRLLLERTALLTLTGAGGSGKTRLALQVAADMLDGSGGGVWLVELAPLTDPKLVPATVANALGLKEEPGKQVLQTLTEHLRTKHLLLVLDNCEHLLSACATLADALLRSCPRVRILATSREGLRISGELTYRVPSLSLPDPTQPETPESLSVYEAVRLFVERAQFQVPQFSVTNQNAPALASICHRVDGIPLAIELAAIRVRSLSLEEINRKLDQRFRLLTGGSRTALPRQQTLRALIDWSYDLLNEAEKALVCRLSVFMGGWTLEAAEAVCPGEPVEEWEVLDLLTSLGDKSLVVAEQQRASTRYRLLAYYLALAERAEPQLTGPEQQAWLERLEAEHDNLRAALEFSDWKGGESGFGLRLAGALFRFWDVRGHLAEGRERLGRALARDGAGDATRRAKALIAAGNLACNLGDYEAAQSLFEESLAIRRELGDRSGIAASLLNLGSLAWRQGDFGAARARIEESLVIRRELGDPRGVALALANLGTLANSQGDYGAARALYEEGLVIQRGLGDRSSIALSLNNLGAVALSQGDYGAARVVVEESLVIRRELGDRQGVADSLFNLGNVACRQGDLGAARTLYAESLVVLREIGDREGLADSLEGTASAAAECADPLLAARLWGAAERLREELGAPLTADERPHYERATAAARAGRGVAFDRAWQEGCAMSLEQAVALALEPGDD
jgi:predicted ATPase/class 3 adenylate cyclase/Tfp pilus assembly protein PilF